MDFASKLKSHPYIIAEIGINHNGYLSLAKKLMYESKKAGADAVKFQKRDISDLVNINLSPGTANGYLSKNANDIRKEKTKFGSWVYPDIRLELTEKDYFQIKNYAKKLKIDLIITPWDEKSMIFTLQLLLVVLPGLLEQKQYRFLSLAYQHFLLREVLEIDILSHFSD